MDRIDITPETNTAPQSVDDEALKKVSGGTGREDIGEDELWFEGTDIDRIAIN